MLSTSMLAEYYEDGWKTAEGGKSCTCPIVGNELDVRYARRKWFDGYYDYQLSQKYPWWIDEVRNARPTNRP